MRNEIFGYKQSKAIEYGLSIEELLILKHFEDFVASGDAEQEYDAETNQVFYWVFYDKFIEDIPIINISKSRLGEIFVHNLGTKPEGFDEKVKGYSDNMRKKIKNRKYVGVITPKSIRGKNGTRSYFAFTKKFYDLKVELYDSEFMQNPTGINTRGVRYQYRKGAVSIPEGFGINTSCKNAHNGLNSNVFDISQNEPNRYQYRNKDNIYIYNNIVDYLNEKTNKNYKASTPKTRTFIQARLNEGFTLEDFKKVIDIKSDAWMGTDMEQYLRPQTLFGTNFEGYLNEAPSKPKKEDAAESSSGLSRFKEL